jgi:hypothetical protein
MTNVHFLWHNVGLIKEVKKRYFIPSAGIRKGLKFAELMKRANEDTELRGWMRKAVYDNSKYIYVNPEEEEKEDKKAVKK